MYSGPLSVYAIGSHVHSFLVPGIRVCYSSQTVLLLRLMKSRLLSRGKKGKGCGCCAYFLSTNYFSPSNCAVIDFLLLKSQGNSLSLIYTSINGSLVLLSRTRYKRDNCFELPFFQEQIVRRRVMREECNAKSQSFQFDENTIVKERERPFSAFDSPVLSCYRETKTCCGPVESRG